MRSRLAMTILLAIVVLVFVMLLYKGKREVSHIVLNSPPEAINTPQAGSEPLEEKTQKAPAEVGDVKDLQKEELVQFINSDMPVVVDFAATNCGACRMLEPVFRTVAGEMKGKMKFAKFMVDLDKNWEIAEKYNVKLTPTMIVFKNGKELGRLIGYKGKDELKNALENFLEK